MKLISVAGTSSNVGKTAVCEMLIRYFVDRIAKGREPGFSGVSALKITTRHSNGCSSGSCGVCDSIEYPYMIRDEGVVIEQEGKDTSRLKDAGAGKVLWLLSFPETLSVGVDSVLDRFDGNEIVVVEGNSFLAVCDADVAILVTRPPCRELKDSAVNILDRIDLVIINNEDGTPESVIADSRNWLNDVGSMAPVVVVDPFGIDIEDLRLKNC